MTPTLMRFSGWIVSCMYFAQSGRRKIIDKGEVQDQHL